MQRSQEAGDRDEYPLGRKSSFRRKEITRQHLIVLEEEDFEAKKIEGGFKRCVKAMPFS
jgi:hypothetical protein